MASFASSYIKTEASQVTRAADAASMTGANFSSWYRADEGTIYLDSPANSSSVSVSSLTISDNTTSNRIFVGAGSSNTAWNPFIIASGTTQATLTQSASFPPQSNPKLVVAYKVNDFAATVSGNSPVTDTSGIIPVVDRMYIGAGATGTGGLNSTIRKISFYPQRLSNAQLQALTS